MICAECGWDYPSVEAATFCAQDDRDQDKTVRRIAHAKR